MNNTIAVIPAAGLAKRLRPLSNHQSKSMIPVNGRPVISYIINVLQQHVDEIRIVCNPHTNDIQKYCDRVYPNLNITYWQQQSPKGPLHAVECALVDGDMGSLIVWLGDTILKPNQLDPSSLTDGESTIVRSEVLDWNRWCMVDDAGNVFDKPNQQPSTNMALIGIYGFGDIQTTHTLIKQINEPDPKTGEKEISQLLKLQQLETFDVDCWYDCGTFESLHHTQASFINDLSRPDNQIYVDTTNNTIVKEGPRCLNEISWYNGVINNYKRALPFLPSIYWIEKDSYCMSYESGQSIQDIIAYEDIQTDTLVYLIDKVINAMNICTVQTYSIIDNHYMWIDKNVDRISKYTYSFIIRNDLDKLINYINGKIFHDIVDRTTESSELIHGDLHFGNILFDFKTGHVKFIDPRGEWNNTKTVCGDHSYDIAKMYQSFYGEYLWIVNDLPTNQNMVSQIDKIFATKFDNVNDHKIKSLIMMISCLPFHDDHPQRQKHIWNTAIGKLKNEHCIL